MPVHEDRVDVVAQLVRIGGGRAIAYALRIDHPSSSAPAPARSTPRCFIPNKACGRLVIERLARFSADLGATIRMSLISMFGGQPGRRRARAAE